MTYLYDDKFKIDVATSLKIKFSQSCTPINEYAKCFFKSDFETGIGCSEGEAKWNACGGGKTGVEMKIQMNNNKTGFEMCVKSHQNLKPYYDDPGQDLNFKPSWIRIDGLDIFLWEDENLTNKLAIFKIDQSIEAKKESMAIVLEDKLKRYSPMQVAQKVKWATGSLVVSFKAFDGGSRKNYSYFQTDFYIPNDNSNDDKKPKNKKPEMEVKKSKKTNENSNDGKKPMNKNPKMEIKKTKKADDEEKSKNKKPNTEVKKRVYKRKIVDDNPDLEKKIKNKNPKMNNKKSKKADDGKKSNNKKPKPEVTKRKKANDNSKDEKKSKNKEPTKVEIKKGKIIINVP